MKEDVQALHDLFDSLSVAWNHGDGKAYGLCFTEDADYVTFHGEHITGRDNIADVHHKLWEGVLRGSTLSGKITNLRFIAPDTAIFHAIGVVQLRWHKHAPKKRNSVNTNVAVKQNGKWKIAAFHNCRIQVPSVMHKVMMKLMTP
ncbi:SgcJ/EcaC family oxidoreductase [Paenibacillus thiaminolyticus]|uniref:SgcJ/EcaC family oxidoreductase n=1 Tax=Paenibacillus thiaminolyticus TaxID=49283 RepID=A0AAP9DRQ9_PANTH|nr:SgcJ/EcaC family oxidoreductase [Paenibacillus thiaminolyticus]MCY9536027.1 SgcJ/EcaC family oxidoreductase [Paenibacillus thiaminolyticus]MCY9602312.1 SgcJ/EcaC family oxidoreductase [Paenibacillus thiaminolyticus]MCY9608707.1 SgcJ/EcaC family oxidoreductase [Paenibacillus thiaminolyticus]MCY9613453.1 SgcJ/EcaC family oxidoreductase [Paenibacillus thiaminolyticus]MCY9620272.1 SgcJ/EcaC family oxidoreductase [Paenibacillus thiaminolyticus]